MYTHSHMILSCSHTSHKQTYTHVHTHTGECQALIIFDKLVDSFYLLTWDNHICLYFVVLYSRLSPFYMHMGWATMAYRESAPQHLVVMYFICQRVCSVTWNYIDIYIYTQSSLWIYTHPQTTYSLCAYTLSTTNEVRTICTVQIPGEWISWPKLRIDLVPNGFHLLQTRLKKPSVLPVCWLNR